MEGEEYLGELPEASFRFPEYLELVINPDTSTLSCFQLESITTTITKPMIKCACWWVTFFKVWKAWTYALRQI